MYGEGACCGFKVCLTDEENAKAIQSVKGQHLKMLHILKQDSGFDLL
jgi:hypothetical protein